MIRASAELTNTFALKSIAQYAADLTTLDEARQAIRYAREQGLTLRTLGEGSNVVLLPQVKGLVCRVLNTGVTVIGMDEQYVSIEVGAGKNWHELVSQTLAERWYGLENLALIPGSVGAAPVQNIGAYGVELEGLLESVTVIRADGSVQELPTSACALGYRDSMFKRHFVATAEPLIIFSVRLRLYRQPRVNLSYTELEKMLVAQSRHSQPTPQEVAKAVIALRQSKLPDPAQFANAGSFFKNPVIDGSVAQRLQRLGVEPYPFQGHFKASAARLIDLSGWKDVRHGALGCWPQQPLVLVNYGGGTAQDLLSFAQQIQRSVQEKFQLELELEPSVVS